MATKTLADLVLNITANSAELTTELEKANSSINKSSKATSGFGKIMDETFKKASGAIDKVIPGFSNMANGVMKNAASVISLSKSLGVLKVALISTGIGAIVVALGSLVALFTASDRGADKFSEKLAGLKAVLQVVVARLVLLGEGLLAFVKGNFREGIDKMKEAFSDLGDEIKRANDEGEALKRSLNNLEDVEAGMILTEAELGNKIKLAREVVNDENASIGEKQKALNTAAAAELELYNKQKAALWEKYRIEKQQNDILRRNGEDNEDMLSRENTILADIENLNGERAMAMSNISRMQKRITKESQDEADARQRIKDIEFALSGKRADISNVKPSINTGIDSILSAAGKSTNQDLIDANANALKTKYAAVADSLTNIFATMFSSIDDGFSGIAKAFGNMLKQMMIQLAAKAAVFGLLRLLTGGTSDIFMSLGSFSDFVFGGSFASGTNYAPGGLSLVGERGPELVNLPKGSQVMNNMLTSRLLSGGEVVFRIEGTELVGVLNKQLKINNSF